MTASASPVLAYAKRPRRRGWQRAVVLVLLLGIAGAAYWYYTPARAWWDEHYATWQFARAFDDVSADLTGSEGTTLWSVAPESGPADDRARAALERLHGRRGLVPLATRGLGLAPTASDVRVLFVRSGETASARWLAFACLTSAGFDVFVVERDDRNGSNWAGAAFCPLEIDDRPMDTGGWTVTRQSADVARVDFTLEGAANSFEWRIAPAPPPTFSGIAPRAADHIVTSVRPTTGWVDPLAGPSESMWQPERGGWKLQTAEIVPRTLAVEGDVRDLAFLPDGRLAVAGLTHLTRFDLVAGTRDRLALPDAVAQGDAEKKDQFRQFAPDGAHLLAGGEDAPYVLIDTNDGTASRRLDAVPRVSRYLFDGAGSVVRVSTPPSRVDCATDARKPALALFRATHTLHAAADGQYVWFGMHENAPAWFVQQRDAVDLVRIDGKPQGRPWLAPDGRTMIEIGYDSFLFDATTGRPLVRFPRLADFRRPPLKPAWSTDGRICAVAGGSYVYVFALDAGKIVRVPHDITGNQDGVTIALSRDGKRLAIGRAGNATVAYWADVDALFAP